MFTITSTRIVGLIAVVCAAVVAPQALAATGTHSRIFLPGDPSDVIQRYELRGELSDQGVAPTAFAAVPSQSPIGQPANNTPGGIDLSDLKNGYHALPAGQPANNTPGGIDLSDLKNGYHALSQIAAAPHKRLKAGSTAAAIEALQRRSVDLDAVYRKLFPSAYKKSAAKPAPTRAVKTAPVVCNGQTEYDYIYSGCER